MLTVKHVLRQKIQETQALLTTLSRPDLSIDKVLIKLPLTHVCLAEL